MKLQVLRLEQNHMATTFDFRISCEESRAGMAERVLLEAHLLSMELERELSEYLPESPVYRLNHSAVGTRILFSVAGFELLKRADFLRALSSDHFNPLAKSLETNAQTPRITWDGRSREVWKETPGAWLGFGAIGKGYALDRVAALIEASGFDQYLLSAGGSSIVFSGRETPSTPWHWGWSWKKNETGQNLGIPFIHSSGKKISLGISGTHEQGEHLLKTGSSRDGADESLSSLVATRSAADADALSTALFVSGWEKAQDYFNRLPEPPAAACIDHAEVPRWNGLFQQLWKGLAVVALIFISSAHADDTVDLSALGDSAKTFTPYIFERNPLWILLPVVCFLLVSVHLIKTKPKRDRPKMRKL